ncbi:MAG: hypothetical protein ACXAEF_03540 [Candidatus Thorarchaeota archaeon]
MQRGVKILLVAIFFVSMLAVSSNVALMHTQFAEAESTNLLAELDLRLEVIIDQTFYADYDEDGLEDDVVTSFRVLILDDDNFILGDESGYTFVIDIETELVLPSGKTNSYCFQVTTSNGVGVTLGWINHATEPGWYDFNVRAACVNVEMNIGQDSVTFDPPGEPGDTPDVAIVLKQL